MDDPALVRGLERVRDLRGDREDATKGNGLREDVAQCGALDELHNEDVTRRRRRGDFFE